MQNQHADLIIIRAQNYIWNLLTPALDLKKHATYYAVYNVV